MIVLSFQNCSCASRSTLQSVSLNILSLVLKGFTVEHFKGFCPPLKIVDSKRCTCVVFLFFVFRIYGTMINFNVCHCCRFWVTVYFYHLNGAFTKPLHGSQTLNHLICVVCGSSAGAVSCCVGTKILFHSMFLDALGGAV